MRSASGVLSNDNEDYRAFRANMRFTPSETFNLNINTGYAWRKVQFAENGNNTRNVVMNALRGGPRGVVYPPEVLFVREDFEISGRFVAVVSAICEPIQNSAHRLTLGID